MKAAGFALVAAVVLAATALAQQSQDAKKQKAPTSPAAPATSNSGSTPTSPPQTATQSGTVPPPEVLLMLIRTTLVALNQANFTGNYTVLHGLGSPTLQANNSPAQLGMAFTALRNQNIDLSPVLVLSPQLSETPTVAPDGTLRLVGFFPTKPLRINFVMIFQPIAGRWRIDGLSVSAVQTPAVEASPALRPSR